MKEVVVVVVEVVAGRFIRSLKTKIYKHMTSISNNVYIDKFDDIVDEYNNTYYRLIQMKLVDTYIDIIHILILIKKLMMKILNPK